MTRAERERYRLIRREKAARQARGLSIHLSPRDLDRIGVPPIPCARERKRKQAQAKRSFLT